MKKFRFILALLVLTEVIVGIMQIYRSFFKRNLPVDYVYNYSFIYSSLCFINFYFVAYS
jgi:hypothetical protein